ncbi:deoxyribodipyrimidine photo-lyase [Vibrio sp. Isolate24]|uniref:deoxyribodipyrimidine photo-lyase n=1 Tax=Vibrio sp. Isolate24 TaxID=2908534 RepID=UPI001EFD7C1B|nr:deoxyribodipyrimidine photo-lyase [Vibrio sp. Isolate24]MCG9677730.1 deoxyribodipyrimidine photo-lyase [Vibrio sp. Isolate24]
MNLVWLRRDLRVEDNTALINAVEMGGPVVCIYVATPETWQDHGLAPIQADLIYRRLQALKQDLESLHIPLLYQQVETYTKSAQCVAEVATLLGANRVYVNKEYEVNEQQRDAKLESCLSHAGIQLESSDDKCLFTPGSVVNKQGSYFKVFTPFKKACLAKLDACSFHVRQPKAVTSSELPEQLGSLLLNDDVKFSYSREPSDQYVVDTQSIIQKLRDFDSQTIEGYARNRDFPAVSGTSQLSPYLAIGALSIRQCMARLMFGQTPPLSQGREVWQSELIWREFYQHLIYFEPKLSKGRSFVDWGERLVWHNKPQQVEAWKLGETGFPIVDAAMRQLNQSGWMHNRLRMIVASFLTKDLHVDWRVGERYFMNKLVDGDYAANNGGWQWCASTGCDGQPYFRIFNPITQGERFDPNGEFVRQWIPELAQVPDKHIHQPWKWSGVRSLSYPSPIVDHKVEREVTLRLYKEAKDA